MTKIGFTGTRNGMSEEQIGAFKEIIKSKKSNEFHHGMCIGSDKQVHNIVKNKKIKVVGHPPTFKKFMAECDCDIFMKPHDYLKRNKNIDIYQAKVKEILIKNKKAYGIKTSQGEVFQAKSVIVCAGTFLKSKIHIGM